MPEYVSLLEPFETPAEWPDPTERTRVAVLHLGAEPPRAWVPVAATALIRHLREEAPSFVDEDRVVVVLVVPVTESDDAAVHRRAVGESLRGVVQSVTREFAHRGVAFNLIVIDADDVAAAVGTLVFLDSPGGAYTSGSAIDLTRSRAA